LVAITLNVYELAAVKPVTTNGDEAPEVNFAPQLLKTVYEDIAPPPTHAGAVKVTDAHNELPAVAVPIVGALATFRALYPGKTIPA
jgi:hypothetical protein